MVSQRKVDKEQKRHRTVIKERGDLERDKTICIRQTENLETSHSAEYSAGYWYAFSE